MTKLYNLSEYKNRRRSLRKTMTPAEGILWSRIKNRQLGYKFKRQYGVGKYIVDFYCSALKIAVEIDGGGHYEESSIVKDIKRTEYLNQFGIKVIRYTNLDIKNKLNSVLQHLKNICDESTRPHPSPLLVKEKG